DPLLGKFPRGAKSRLEALVIRLVERAILDAAILREDLPAGDQIEVRLPVIHFDQRRRVRPAKAEIQRQLLGRLEIVLRENSDAILKLRPRLGGVAAPSALARREVEQEIRKRIPGERAVVADESK